MKTVNSPKETDTYLDDRLAQYDKWISGGKINYSSKVIPISESIESKQWVLSTNQAIQILRNARTFALTECECRLHYRRCNNPLEVCFLIDDAADKSLRNGKGKKITSDQASIILKKANQYGLVHLTIYHPDHKIYALCNCCDCCCHDLQILKEFCRTDFISASDYIENTNKVKND